MFDGFDHAQLEHVGLGFNKRPPPRAFGIGAAFVGESCLVAGGRRDGIACNTVYASLDGGSTFSRVTGSSSWCPRSHHALISCGEIVYLVGGFNGENGECGGMRW